MQILRSPREIAKMRQAGLLVWQAHRVAESLLRPGATTAEIDEAVEQFFREHRAVPLFKGVPGKIPFPAVCCISINEEVVHGIPGPRKLVEGDIVSIDTGCKVNGWCGDAALTHGIGQVCTVGVDGSGVEEVKEHEPTREPAEREENAPAGVDRPPEEVWVEVEAFLVPYR